MVTRALSVRHLPAGSVYGDAGPANLILLGGTLMMMRERRRVGSEGPLIYLGTVALVVWT